MATRMAGQGASWVMKPSLFFLLSFFLGLPFLTPGKAPSPPSPPMDGLCPAGTVTAPCWEVTPVVALVAVAVPQG